MNKKIKISDNIKENEKYIRERCKNCADILIRPMRLGEESKVDCLIVYIEVADTGFYQKQQSRDC